MGVHALLRLILQGEKELCQTGVLELKEICGHCSFSCCCCCINLFVYFSGFIKRAA